MELFCLVGNFVSIQKCRAVSSWLVALSGTGFLTSQFDKMEGTLRCVKFYRRISDRDYWRDS